MKTVVVNPRKLTHEEAWQQENAERLERFARIKEAVCDCSRQEGMKRLGFTDKEYYRQFKAAFYLAEMAHQNQVDKAGMDYICHPVTVAWHVKETYPVSRKRDRAMVVALLHDVLEDTPVTVDALKSFAFDDKIISTVGLLSRSPGDSYDAYLEKLQVSKAAMRIKCADMTDNENLNRLKEPAARDVHRSAFYRSRRLVLESHLREKKRRKEKQDKDIPLQINTPII